MKKLVYYGVEENYEETKRAGFPYYTKGLFSYVLKDGENENIVRKTIEDRCTSNPDCNFMPHIFGGFSTSYFKWLN